MYSHTTASNSARTRLKWHSVAGRRWSIFICDIMHRRAPIKYQTAPGYKALELQRRIFSAFTLFIAPLVSAKTRRRFSCTVERAPEAWNRRPSSSTRSPGRFSNRYSMVLRMPCPSLQPSTTLRLPQPMGDSRRSKASPPDAPRAEKMKQIVVAPTAPHHHNAPISTTFERRREEISPAQINEKMASVRHSDGASRCCASGCRRIARGCARCLPRVELGMGDCVPLPRRCRSRRK